MSASLKRGSALVIMSKEYSGSRLRPSLVYSLIHSMTTYWSPNACRGLNQSSGCKQSPKASCECRGRGGP